MNKRWASEGECVEALGLSHTVLTRLRASGDLVAGDHWIWIGGQRNGKVGYDLDRIETWQRERTAQIVRDLRQPNEPFARKESGRSRHPASGAQPTSFCQVGA